MRGWATSSARVLCRCSFVAEVIGTAPIERVDVLHGTQGRANRAALFRRAISVAACACCGRAPSIAAVAARRSGRASWRLPAIASAALRKSTSSIPSARCSETAPGTALAWTSVTTGNLAGIDLWLDDGRRGTLKIETNVVSGEIDLAALTDNAIVFDGGMLNRKLSVYRLPEDDWSRPFRSTTP